MDAFEQIVTMVLETRGYWVRNGFWVDLSPQVRELIGRPTTPRWELDMLAFRPGNKEVIAVECRSYLDAIGVTAQDFGLPRKVRNEKTGRMQKVPAPMSKTKITPENRYKLFLDHNLRSVILNCLQAQLIDQGFITSDTKVRLGFATGKFRSGKDREEVRALFKKPSENLVLISDLEIQQELAQMSRMLNSNDVAMVASKILMRREAEFAKGQL